MSVVGDILLFAAGLLLGSAAALVFARHYVPKRAFDAKGGVYVPREALVDLAIGDVTLEDHLNDYGEAVKRYLEKNPVRVARVKQ